MRASHRFFKGLYYFPLFTNIAEDDKIKVLISEHKHAGFAFLVHLWCSTFKKNYYKVWNPREKKLFCGDYGFTEDEVDSFMITCFAEELFDEKIFKKFGILTSKRVQETWGFATERRVVLTFIKEYLLINTDIIPNNKRVRIINLANKDKEFEVPATAAADKPAKGKQPEGDQPKIREFTYQDVITFTSINYDDRDAEFKANYSRDDYDEYLAVNEYINNKFDNIRVSKHQLTFPEYIEFLDVIKPTPMSLDIYNAFKKMSELGPAVNTNIFLRLEKCMDYIRNPFKPPALAEEFSPTFYRDPDLEKTVLDFFGFNEFNNPDKLVLFSSFLTVINNKNQLDNFKTTFNHYKEYKVLTGLQYVHKFTNFIGNQSERFENGVWSSENWHKKLIDEKNKKGKNGTQHQRRPTPTNGSDFGQI